MGVVQERYGIPNQRHCLQGLPRQFINSSMVKFNSAGEEHKQYSRFTYEMHPNHYWCGCVNYNSFLSECFVQGFNCLLKQLNLDASKLSETYLSAAQNTARCCIIMCFRSMSFRKQLDFKRSACWGKWIRSLEQFWECNCHTCVNHGLHLCYQHCNYNLKFDPLTQ